MLSIRCMTLQVNRYQFKELRIFPKKRVANYKCTFTHIAKNFHNTKATNRSISSISPVHRSNILTKHTKRDLVYENCMNNDRHVVVVRYYSVDNNGNSSPNSQNTSRNYIDLSKLKNAEHPEMVQKRIIVNNPSEMVQDNQNHKAVALESKKENDFDLENEELHFDRNFITAIRAMKEFLLKPENLVGLRVTSRRSAKDNDVPLNVYWRKDVEHRSLTVWGSMEAMEKEKESREKQALSQKEFVSFYKRYFTRSEERKKLNRKSWPVRALRPTTENDGLKSESGKVVLWAIGINGGNTILKLIAWLATGSHAMFSEVIHSAADTLNQVILAYGIKSSAKKADENHPYGYTNMQYVSSLISGVGIFCLGAGLSVYHGIDGLANPHNIESINVAFAILGMSFLSESVTLGLAVKSIRESASFANMGFVEYVVRGYDPCVNVVLLEDTAAVLGVMIAAASMSLSAQYGSHIPDAIGSIVIGGLLGTVATFMITTNSNLLVGMY